MFVRKPVLNKAKRRHVAVNFLDNQGSLTGYLAEFDDETYVLEQCETVPDTPGAQPQPVAGRQYIDRIHCWLQELDV